MTCVLVKTTLVDYPGRVAAACFLKGCNMRCPYCYNRGLVEPASLDDKAESDFVSKEDVILHLKKRRRVLSGFVISGGEPLCSFKKTEFLIKEAKALGYKVKLDTNGMLPDLLNELLQSGKAVPDYIALDVKTDLQKYQGLAPAIKDAKERLLKSVSLLSALPAEKREFRTVLYPPLVNMENIKSIASILPKDAAWFFAGFRPENCLCKEAEKILPYTENEEKEIAAAAKAIIPGAVLR